jgi:hypothetical protein
MGNVEKIIAFVILFQFVARLLRGLFKAEGYDDILSDQDTSNDHEDDTWNKVADERQDVNLWIAEQDIELSIQNLMQIKEHVDSSLKKLTHVSFRPNHTQHYKLLNRVKQSIRAQLNDLSEEITACCTTQELPKK